MPRTPTQEVFYVGVAAAEFKKKAKTALVEVKAIRYTIEQPAEPLLFRLVIPQIEAESAKEIVTVEFEDETVAGKPQVFQTAKFGKNSEAAAPFSIVVERRIVPETNFTELPALQGERTMSVFLTSTIGEVTIPKAEAANGFPFFQILGLGRQ